MPETIPVFIGYDQREAVAWHVLAYSIMTRTSSPVAFTAVGNDVLPSTVWRREPGPHDSTAFSNARFAVPALMGYSGWAIFMDCDMVCLGDIAELWGQRDDRYAVQVVKHTHNPSETSKFLGAPQSKYPRKNWSSLMLFNCSHPSTRELTPEYTNQAAGLDLHGFAWATADQIGEIRGLWNVLAVGSNTWNHPIIDRHLYDRPSLLHYTRGGPWHGVRDRGSELWDNELRRMLVEGNPAGAVTSVPVAADHGLAVNLRYACGAGS